MPDTNNSKSWSERAEHTVNHYLHLEDGGFDENMKCTFATCNEKAKTITYKFETQKWQINERGGIHGGAISGMFDTAFGITANFTAGPTEATTVDMNISYIRPLELGQHCLLTVYIIKAGRSLIRQRGELFCEETGKLIATGYGSWMPL